MKVCTACRPLFGISDRNKQKFGLDRRSLFWQGNRRKDRKMASQNSARGRQTSGRRTSKKTYQSQDINSDEIVYVHNHSQNEDYESDSEQSYHEIATGDARDVVIQPEDVSDMSR